ncbi:MAG: CBS domain-containing protein, partial [Lacticaseibacillus paracasei]
DTFTVATMINRALSDQAIKQDILTVAAIYTPLAQIQTIGVEATVGDYLLLPDPRYPLPVVTRNGRLVGVMRPSLVGGKKPTVPIERLMQKDPQTVKPYLSVTAVGHTMQDNGLTAMPVVDDSWNLLGIVTRNAVFSSLTGIAHSRELSNTIADQVSAQLTAITPQPPYVGGYELKTVPAMTNSLGTMSFGVLAEAINGCTTRYLHDTGRRNVLVEGLNLTTFRPIQLESVVTVLLRELEMTRHDATLDVDVLSDGVQVAKAIVTCQLLERN